MLRRRWPRVEAAGTVFQAEQSVCRGPGVQVCLPGAYAWAETGRRCEDNEAGEVSGDQVLKFSECPHEHKHGCQ